MPSWPKDLMMVVILLERKISNAKNGGGLALAKLKDANIDQMGPDYPMKESRHVPDFHPWFTNCHGKLWRNSPWKLYVTCKSLLQISLVSRLAVAIILAFREWRSFLIFPCLKVGIQRFSIFSFYPVELLELLLSSSQFSQLSLNWCYPCPTQAIDEVLLGRLFWGKGMVFGSVVMSVLWEAWVGKTHKIVQPKICHYKIR